MGKNAEQEVQVYRARPTEARGLAVLDSWRFNNELHADYIKEREAFWREKLVNEKEQQTEIYIAREGGLNLGYLALVDKQGLSPLVDLCYGPKARCIEAITKALFKEAKVIMPETVTTTPVSDNLAVA